MTTRPKLHIVADDKPAAASAAEEMLAHLVPDLIKAEEIVALLRGLVDSWRRELANERGVAFVREEHVRREFGGEAKQ
jgi:hypothetical protein